MLQPKKSAVPIFRRMLASHERSLMAARGHSEPAAQIAAREMEIIRIKGALQRAEELSDDVSAVIERAGWNTSVEGKRRIPALDTLQPIFRSVVANARHVVPWVPYVHLGNRARAI